MALHLLGWEPNPDLLHHPPPHALPQTTFEFPQPQPPPSCPFSPPSPQTTFNSLISEAATDPPPDAYAPRCIATAALPALLGRYQAAASNISGWVTPDQLNLTKQAVTQVTKELTDSYYGLQYFNPNLPEWRYPPDSTPVVLNSWAVWVVEQASALQVAGAEDEGAVGEVRLGVELGSWAEGMGGLWER